MPLEEIIEKPEEIARVPAIPGALKIYKVIKKYNSKISNLESRIFQSIWPKQSIKPFYRKDDDPTICDNIDVDVDNNTCAYCLKPC